jgi:hypothetical protein
MPEQFTIFGAMASIIVNDTVWWKQIELCLIYETGSVIVLNRPVRYLLIVRKNLFSLEFCLTFLFIGGQTFKDIPAVRYL